MWPQGGATVDKVGMTQRKETICEATGKPLSVLNVDVPGWLPYGLPTLLPILFKLP